MESEGPIKYPLSISPFVWVFSREPFVERFWTLDEVMKLDCNLTFISGSAKFFLEGGLEFLGQEDLEWSLTEVF